MLDIRSENCCEALRFSLRRSSDFLCAGTGEVLGEDGAEVSASRESNDAASSSAL